MEEQGKAIIKGRCVEDFISILVHSGYDVTANIYAKYNQNKSDSECKVIVTY